MIGDSKFPRVWKKDGDDFAGSKPGGNQASGKGFHEFCIFPIGEPAVAGGIDQGDLTWVSSTTLKDNVMNEKSGGISIKLSTGHRGKL